MTAVDGDEIHQILSTSNPNVSGFGEGDVEIVLQ